jgi:hypothetical protein
VLVLVHLEPAPTLPAYHGTNQFWAGTQIGELGWSEPAAINAPVEDEPVQPVLRMNILPAPSGFFFSLPLCPEILYLPPTSPLLPSSLLSPLLPPPSLPPTYHLPTPPPPHSITKALETLSGWS